MRRIQSSALFERERVLDLEWSGAGKRKRVMGLLDLELVRSFFILGRYARRGTGNFGESLGAGSALSPSAFVSL